MKVVAFGHRRFVGKDTASNFLVSHIRAIKRNVLVRKIGFASKGKAVCHELYSWAGLQDEEFYEQHPELKDVVIPALRKSPRELWIGLMDTLRNECYHDTWIKFALQQLRCDYLIIKDMRYPNEGYKIKEVGGLLIRIDNPRVQKYFDPADSAMENFNQFDKVIVNDGTLAELNLKVIAATREYLFEGSNHGD